MAFDATEEARRQDARRRALPVGPVSRAAQVQAASRRRQRAIRDMASKLTRMLMLVAAVIVGSIGWGLVAGGIGTSMLMTIIMATIVTLVLLGIYPRPPAPDATTIVRSAPAKLPAMTDAWLDRRRRALPALAAPQIDSISARLAVLEPQLAALPANDPVAADLNRLLGQHLPELVDRYTKVPVAQRKVDASDGSNIEKRLIDGLTVVDSELARVSEQLAEGDRNAFLIQGRFLESRYGNEEIK